MRERILSIAPQNLLILPVLIVCFTTVQAVVASFLGVQVSRVRLGFGPKVVGFGRVWVCALPLGASMTLGPEGDNGVYYAALPTWKKLVLQLSGVAGLAGLAWPLGQWHPDLGLLCLLVGLANLAPLPGTAGGQVLVAAGEAATGRRLPVGVLGIWTALGLLGLGAGAWWLFFGG